MDQNELRQLAKQGIVGEIARLNTLLQQIDNGRVKRPYVRRATSNNTRAVARKRKPMSRAMRKRMSDLMKARWAQRRRAQR